VKREQEAREGLEREFNDAEKTHESELRYERRRREDKDSALHSALDDLSRAQSLLSQRESDLEAVQNALRETEQRSKELGETHTTARFSLQLGYCKNDTSQEVSRAATTVNTTHKVDRQMDRLTLRFRYLFFTPPVPPPPELNAEAAAKVVSARFVRIISISASATVRS